MSRNIVQKIRRAQRDLENCYTYFELQNPDVAKQFLQAAERTFALLAEMPGIGAPYKVKNPSMKGLRKLAVKDFTKYLVFYLPVNNGIKIIRVLHSSRDIRTIIGYDK